MNEIGGYFELELQDGKHYHKGEVVKLNTARNCLEYILMARGCQKIYIPYYTCGVILEPIEKCNVRYEFYHININLDPEKEIDLKDDEVFLYTNYFGLKQETVDQLARVYNSKLIVDNSQAFFSKPLENIDTFYSARKFFGVPDGAYLYTNKHLDEDFEQDVSFDRMTHLLKRIDIGAENGYDNFMVNSKSLENQEIKRMSNLTDRILKSIDYESVKQRRVENYAFLDKHLHTSIKLKFDENTVPMVYPYYSKNKKLKDKLIQNKIFIPTYWKNVLDWCKDDSFEYKLTENLLLLPIDQRYNQKDLKKILKFVITE